jgi:hypothetical protein
MKVVHPIPSCILNVALIVFSVGVNGCKSTSNGVGNPFLAPDRVPPPSTHALLPGQAQPYYQGDPLPSAFQGPPSAPAEAVAAKSTQSTLSPSGRTLAWNAPAGAAAAAPTAPVQVPAASIIAPAASPEPQATAAVNEAKVAVPTDTDPLRYSLPQSPRVEPSPAPSSSVAVPPANNPIVAQAGAATHPAPAQNVSLASYNTPAPAAPQPNPPAMPVVPQQPPAPWRSPQVLQPLNSPSYAAQQGSIQPLVGSLPAPPAPSGGPLVQPPVAIPTNTMAATLRAVTPPSQPGDAMPRIRMPDYLPPPPIGTADGFRPRSSMQ